jgi:NADH:ubiquinone oxidoreductase subunit 3 (subunit A)
VVGSCGSGGGRIRFAMLALSFLSLTIAIPFALALAVSFASSQIVLMVGAMTLLVEVTVAIEAATGVERLAIHNVWLLEA